MSFMTMSSIALWLRQATLFLFIANAIGSAIDTCPGYYATNIVKTDSGVTADLSLAGASCNTYGSDIKDLKLEVAYQTNQRIHVKISDSANQVYQIPSEVLQLPPDDSGVSFKDADLAFNFVAKPFSFSITRRATNEILFNTAGFPIVFESQYLLLRTSLPDDPNLYGLGEHSDTFRLPTVNFTRTLWSRDAGGVPAGTNLYGNHPVYYEHRVGTGTHGVFLANSNGMDIKINRTTEEGQTLSYNTNGGIIDLFFVSGSTPIEAVQQYSEVVGKSAMMPYWSLGLHQCAYNMPDVIYVAEVIANYSAAKIPLQTMWTDIDYMDHGKMFTDAVPRWPLKMMREVVTYLHTHGQNYILASDPGIGMLNYSSYNRGVQDGIFMKRSNGSIFAGVVWAGPTAWPDWFHPKAQAYWNNEFEMFFDPASGIDIDGLWIDMNEVSNFCSYPCSDPAAGAAAAGVPFVPWSPVRTPPRPIAGFPADFQPVNSTNSTSQRRSTNPRHSTKHRSLTNQRSSVDQRRSSPGNHLGLPGRNLLYPPYAIQNYNGMLSQNTLDTSLIHANGLAEYDTHNIYGLMTSIAGQRAMLNRRPKSRPFVISRSSFAGSGKEVGHWLGDNNAFWPDYRKSIAGVLNFASLFQAPMVGVDVCGFGNITTEQLCGRWAMLGAFSPFYRNHNSGWQPHEFYRWESVTLAAQKAIAARYKMLDYLYTALQQQSTKGTPTLNPLWFLYPEDKNTFAIQYQFFFGNAVLVSPVLEENSTSVEAYFPDDIFYDLWTYEPLRGSGANVLLQNLTVTDIPVHIRGGTIIPMRIESAMSLPELRTQAFDIVVASGLNGLASGELYLDDGDSIVQEATSNIELNYSHSQLKITGSFGYNPGVGISQITFLGVDEKPNKVAVNSASVSSDQWTWDSSAKVLKVQVALKLDSEISVSFT